jgi:hypothetical protein
VNGSSIKANLYVRFAVGADGRGVYVASLDTPDGHALVGRESFDACVGAARAYVARTRPHVEILSVKEIRS